MGITISNLGYIANKFSERLVYQNFGNISYNNANGSFTLPENPQETFTFYGTVIQKGGSALNFLKEGTRENLSIGIYSEKELNIEPDSQYSIVTWNSKNFRLNNKDSWLNANFFMYSAELIRSGRFG